MTVETGAGTAWTIDASHSYVEFRVRHLGIGWFCGRFMEVQGEATFDEDDLAAARVSATVPARSVGVPGERFVARLLAPEFLDAEGHPELTFESTRVEPREEGWLRLVGELGMRGIHREVAFEAAYHGRARHPLAPRELAAFSASATIARADWGLTWNVPMEAGALYLGEEIAIRLEIELARAISPA